jgi:LysM repeat protein
MFRIRLIALSLVLSAGLAHAGIDNAGTTAGNFLSVGTGASVLSMGGATLGAGRDLNASAWNPAVLGFMNSSEYALSHATLALDVSQDWIAASGRVGRSVTRWSASALYQNDGTFDGRDPFGAPTGSFNVSNLALGLAVARPFSPDVTAGARFHLVNESLGSSSGSGLGFDLGVQARRGAFGFGAAARNLGGKMKYDSGSFDLPGVYGLGASWSAPAKGVRLALDANFPHAYYNDVRLGGEWMWQQRVALRAGYRLELGAASGEPLGGPSFGFGTGVNGLWFDYAFLAGSSNAQGAHRFGLTFHPSVFQQRGARPFSDAGDATASQAPVAATPAAEPVKESPKPAEPAAPVLVAPTPAAPAPVALVAPTPAPPVASEPEAPHIAIVIPEGATDAQTQARVTEPAPAKFAKAKLVKVAKLAEAKAGPVASAPVAVAPSAPAPVAVAPSAPAADAPVRSAAPAVAQLAATPAPMVVVVRPSAPRTEARPSSVTVQKDETMAVIAKRWGTSVPAIMMENNLVTSTVKNGQKLKLPKP